MLSHYLTCRGSRLMFMSLADIARSCNGRLYGDASALVEQVAIDSRLTSLGSATLFFCLKGRATDGHHFIPELLQRGISHFVVNELPDNTSGGNFILVNDVLKALQDVAATFRQRFKGTVIAVTGSNGKTIVKEWLAYALSATGTITKSPGSYNSQVGVPLSVCQIFDQASYAVLEAGISKPGEMASLTKILQPEIGVFTTLGTAHQENFVSLEQKVKEKFRLFTRVNGLVYCADHQIIKKEAEDGNYGFRHITWARNAPAWLKVNDCVTGDGYTEIFYTLEGFVYQLRVPFTDRASVENALHVLTLLHYLGVDQLQISSSMATLPPIGMRLEQRSGINGCIVINDTYNSDLQSLGIALEFLSMQKQHEKRTVILSDILQSGLSASGLYRQVADMLKTYKVTRFIGVGPQISAHRLFFSNQSTFYPDTESFIRTFDPASYQSETILVKGARDYSFERIVQLLERKLHRTVLEVNLGALVHNLNYYRSKLAPGTKIMAMVKALSYGSGTFEIANLLTHHRVDYLAVAYADEGVELRQAGIQLPIMVMSPEEDELERIFIHRLEPEIYSLRLLHRVCQLSAGATGQQFPVHIKIDTGMHRLGFDKNETGAVINALNSNPGVLVRSVFSHLAASDEEVHDTFTRLQIERLSETAEEIRHATGQIFLRHICNSSAIERFPHAQLDMVRLGIGLYGIGSKWLRNVASLKTRVSQVRNVAPGETVGYSRKGEVYQPKKIAVIPIGYADGFSRKLGNGNGKFLINGKFAPVIGNVCMDMCMADVTELEVAENDEVLVFGDTYPVDYIAQQCNTIPYEVLTSVSSRVRRVYIQE